MAKGKLVPAIEVALSTTVTGAIGGVAIGAGGVLLPLQLPGIPNWLLVIDVFIGIFLVTVAVLGAINHDDRVTEMIESTFPPSPEEVEERLRYLKRERK